ncbi:cation:proton antiporter [Streptomyces sp. NBC_01808]|uniref:cation:proton antiporter domain-containing protein n=1 Tax=Streptomyces sp. NBC_01808 TaxID=2975947 RepID=UPI002DD87518|nr:cation:proton antiporter [Streptomyces sp. NBC_01808]WSA37277.1 cation:proton antiporter [Streptomyces sp. NBC_01808]
MEQLTLLLALVLGALITLPVAQRLGLPAPVLMTLLGGVLALLPFVPTVEIPPEFILPLVLPPLLYAAVQRTSWRQFAHYVRPVLLLAVALVFVTTAAVAATASGDFNGALVGAAAAVVGVVVGVRLLWLLPAAALAQRLHQRGGHPDEDEEIPKAARARLAEIEQVQELPEEMAEKLQWAAYGIATRLYPDLVDEDRREAHAQRLERLRTSRKITGELLSAARHELLAARSEGYDPEILDRVLGHLDVRTLRAAV